MMSMHMYMVNKYIFINLFINLGLCFTTSKTYYLMKASYFNIFRINKSKRELKNKLIKKKIKY